MVAQATPRLSLQTADYIVFGAMFLFTLGIGIRYAWAGRKSATKETYFVADRKMHYLPVAVSLLVTFASSIMMLGLPAEVYVYGTSIVVKGLAIGLTYVFVAYAAVPLFKPLKITSVYEYLQLRFRSRTIRMCGVYLFLLNTLFYVGVVLYAQAVAVEAVMGVNLWVSVVLMDGCAVIYTALGGIKSVVWTDVFQAVIMVTGIYAVIIKGTIDTGGAARVWEIAMDGGRLDWLDFDPDPTVRHTVWSLFLPGILSSFLYVWNQATVQRISAARSMQGARRMAVMSAPLVLFLFLSVIVEGIVIYAFFKEKSRLEPLTCGTITNPNQIVPYAVLILFQHVPGMAGLFMASLYSGSLSTISSSLSSMSILVMEDVVSPRFKNIPEARVTLYAKASVLFLGVLCLLFCAMASLIQGPLHQVATILSSATNGPLIGLFFLASFFPSCNAMGAGIGILIGFVMSSVLALGSKFSPDVRSAPWLPLGNVTMCEDVVNSSSSEGTSRKGLFGMELNTTTTIGYNVSDADARDYNYNAFFSLSYALFTPCGILVTIATGLIVSRIMGRNRPGDVNPKYFLEISDSLLFFLPPFVRRWLKRCGTQYKTGWKPTTIEVEVEDTLGMHSGATGVVQRTI